LLPSHALFYQVEAFDRFRLGTEGEVASGAITDHRHLPTADHQDHDPDTNNLPRAARADASETRRRKPTHSRRSFMFRVSPGSAAKSRCNEGCFV
jgi:hypothetical protein